MASDSIDLLAPGVARPCDGNQPIPTIATTTVAFIGRTARGSVNEAVPVKDFDDFRRMFGGFCAFSFMAHAVQHFFVHGGETAIVVRVANRATRAMLEIPAAGEQLRLQARQPGSREFLRASVDYDGVERDSKRFNLVVQRLGKLESELVDDQELFQGLSLDPDDQRYVAAALLYSRLVRLSGPLPANRPDATQPARTGEAIPYVGMSAGGADGDELTDYDIIGSNHEGTGLHALDRWPSIDLVCIPAPPGRDLKMTSFVAATRYCERRRAMLVWDPPSSWSSADAAVLCVRSTGQASPNAVAYFPRVRARTERFGQPSEVPACGVIAGALARGDRSGVWRRLPWNDSGLKGGLAPVVDVSAKHAAMLNRVGINALGHLHAGGAAVHGNVTFAGANSSSDLWQRLDTRRLVLFILRSIEQHTRWVLETELPDVAAALEQQVATFLTAMHQEGAFSGAGAQQAFFVRANFARARPLGERHWPLILRVGLALQKPAKFAVYELHYEDQRVSTQVLPVCAGEQ